jgi:hypothetical protein
MDWLKNHVYIASWSSPSPVIAIILAILKSKGNRANIDMLGFVFYVIALGSFAALVSLPVPAVEKSVYVMLIVFCLGASVRRES